MLDIGFWELVVIAVIGIVVVGPEKLPGLVKKVILYSRKIKNTIHEVKYGIERELDVDGLRKFADDSEIGKTINDFNGSIDEVKTQSREITQEIDHELHDVDIGRYQQNVVPTSQISPAKKADLSGISNDVLDHYSHQDWNDDALDNEYNDQDIDK